MKSFEAKKQKNEPLDYERIARDEWELADERSYISFDKFFDNLPFSEFNKYEYGKIHDAGINAPLTNSNRHSYSSFSVDVNGQKLTFSSSNSITAPPYFSDNKDWTKRNLMIYISVNTGGASGGSCYDTGEDDGAFPYDGESIYLSDFLDYLKPKLDVILEDYANTKSSSELIELLRTQDYNLIREDSYSNYEYYGNYDDYGVLYITLYDLFKFLAKNDAF